MPYIHTSTTGQGPDLVLLHGWGISSSIWEPVLPLLKPHFRVTTIDLPGIGKSEWDDSLNSLEKYAKYLLPSIVVQINAISA